MKISKKDKHVNGAGKGNILRNTAVEPITRSLSNCFTMPTLMSVKRSLPVIKVVKITKTKLDLSFHSGSQYNQLLFSHQDNLFGKKISTTKFYDKSIFNKKFSDAFRQITFVHYYAVSRADHQYLEFLLRSKM